MMGRLLTLFAAVLSAWCADLPQTLTLRQAEAAALSNHPRISAAQLEAEAARRQVTEIRSSLYPAVTANLTGAGAGDKARIAAGALNNPIIYSRAAAGFTASQLLYDFGRTGDLASSYRFNAIAQQDLAHATQADIALAVRAAYFRALRAQSVLTVASETVNARQVVADQVHALAASKLKSGLDVSFADVNLSEARLLLVSARNNVDAAFADLSAAMGLASPAAFTLVDEPMPPAPPDDFRGILESAIRQRPELEALRARQEAALKLFQSEKNLWLPTVSAVTTMGVIPGHSDLLPGKYAAAGLNISVPVFNGHLFSARREEADLRARAAAARVQDQQLSIMRDLRASWLRAQDAFQRLDLTRQLYEQSRQALDLAQARYHIGLSSMVELSQAQLSLTSAQIAQASARYDYQLRHSELLYQMGELH
ncbi:MAG TPA: TolC family protein [Bryobacteraceae bacterium]|nr:TolC family protein [Bryobacteraceae bacterium]